MTSLSCESLPENHDPSWQEFGPKSDRARFRLLLTALAHCRALGPTMASTAPSLRLCLAVECGARMAPLWQALLHGMIEPILAHYGPSLELALVLFGAHPPHSLAAVESSIGWTSDADEQQRLLGDAQFIGGGGSSPVALAEALLEVAALFAIADASPDAAAPQQHCLVCMTSDPAVHPVPWPCAEDCDMVRARGGH